jgi:hypothetical protein
LILLLRRAAAQKVAPFSQFLFIVLVIGLVGCSIGTSPPAPQLSVPQWQSDRLIESLTERRKQLQSLRALARVDYAGPEGKQGFQEAVVVQRPDRLRLETLTFLGAILIVTANPKEIVGYHPREGVFVRGRPSKENLRRYTQIPLELEEVTALLVGLPPVEAKASWNQEANALIFSSNGRKKESLAFESQQPVPTKWERFGDDGKVELSAQFSEYISTAAGLFPVHIVFEAHRQKKKLEIRYQEPDVNGTITPDLFIQQKPANVKEVPIEAIGS